MAVARSLSTLGCRPGFLSMVFGAPAMISERLITAPQVRKVSFTGSTAIGCETARVASGGVKPCMLELGGHAPVIIRADADLDRAVSSAVSSKFHNSGQSCRSPNRIYIHNSLYARFAERSPT